MIIKRENGRTLAFLPTWRLVSYLGMYCGTVVQIGAWFIFWIENKPIHPLGQILLVIGAATTFILGHFVGQKDRQKMREVGAQLEVTWAQQFVLIACIASVPGSLLFLVLLSGL